MSESEETEEMKKKTKKHSPSTLSCYKDSRPNPQRPYSTVSRYQLNARYTTPFSHQTIPNVISAQQRCIHIAYTTYKPIGWCKHTIKHHLFLRHKLLVNKYILLSVRNTENTGFLQNQNLTFIAPTSRNNMYTVTWFWQCNDKILYERYCVFVVVVVVVVCLFFFFFFFFFLAAINIFCILFLYICHKKKTTFQDMSGYTIRCFL